MTINEWLGYRVLSHKLGLSAQMQIGVSSSVVRKCPKKTAFCIPESRFSFTSPVFTSQFAEYQLWELKQQQCPLFLQHHNRGFVFHCFVTFIEWYRVEK